MAGSSEEHHAVLDERLDHQVRLIHLGADEAEVVSMAQQPLDDLARIRDFQLNTHARVSTLKLTEHDRQDIVSGGLPRPND